MREMNASEFKTHCLSLLDEIVSNGEEITILKRGRPVARLVPVSGAPYPQLSLRGTVHVLGDIVSPAADPDEWEANS